jgi:hypothetical protein
LSRISPDASDPIGGIIYGQKNGAPRTFVVYGNQLRWSRWTTLGTKADATTHYRPVNDLRPNFLPGLDCTTQRTNLTGLSRRRKHFNPGSAAWLSNHPIRPRQHARRDREADLLCRFEVDYQIELCSLKKRSRKRSGFVPTLAENSYHSVTTEHSDEVDFFRS